MKIKNIIAALFMLPVLAGMTACSEKEADYSGRGEWDAADGYAQIYFATTSESQSVDPAAPTTYMIEVLRRDSERPALTAKPTVLENTGEVFTVSDAVFAAGDSIAYITVNYPNAEIGKEYTLQITFDDPELTSIYSSNIVYTYTVIRVKWNLLGIGMFAENFWWEGENEVEIYQRDDNPTQFRIMNPFNEMTWYEGEDDSDGSQSPYVDLTISQKGEAFLSVKEATVDGLVYFTPMNSGYFHPSYGDHVYLYHPSAFSNFQTEDTWSYNKVLAWQDENLPGRIQLAPYYYIPAAGGGWNNTTANDVVIIDFPGYEDPYVAQVEDYEWEEVYAGEFKSNQLGTSVGGVKLYRGLPVDEVEQEYEGCYELADSLYGTIYKIGSPYASGYDLVFYVNEDGEITLSEETELQPIGIKAVGKDVYAKINANKSLFGETEVALSITFQTEPDVKGDYTDYGTADEILSNIKWNAIAAGTYTYAYFWEGDDEGLLLYQREDKPNLYKIEDWGGGVDFVFNMNSKNEISFEGFYIGYTDGTYGDIWMWDLNALYPNQFPQGYYADGIYHFNTYYGMGDPDDGYFGYGEEIFTITDTDTESASVKVKPAKVNKPIKKTLSKSRSVRSKVPSRSNGFTKGVVRSSKPAISYVSYDLFSKYAK